MIMFGYRNSQQVRWCCHIFARDMLDTVSELQQRSPPHNVVTDKFSTTVNVSMI